MEHFHAPPHACRGQAAATKYVDSFVGDLVGGAGGEHLEQADGPRQVSIALVVRHLAHLVRDVFEVRLDGFGVGNDFGESGEAR